MNGFFLASGLIWLAFYGLAFWRFRSNVANQRYDRDILAAGVLCALTIGFFWRTVSGDVYQPADGGDLVSFLFPTYRFAAAQLATGDLPLWNPTLYGGAPFISDIQAGYLYPPNLLLFLLQPAFPYAALQWMSIGHIFWAGLGVYVLLRTLRWPQAPVMRTAAVFGAIAFQFSDPLLIHFGNLNLIAALSWMPWIFALYTICIGTCEGRRRLALAGSAGVLLAISVYAGHAQSTLYIGLALLVYTTLRALIDVRSPETHAGSARSWQVQANHIVQGYVVPLLVVAALAILLAAPVLLPAMELSGYTERSDYSYQDTVAFSLAPTQAIGLLTPSFFGRGPALHWSLWERVELPYAGVATLLMTAAALLLASVNRRRQLWPWFGLGLFGLATALGIYAIVHGWLTVLLPMFDQFRAPARALVLWTFALSVCSAVGVDQVAKRGLAPFDPTSRPDTLRTLLRFGSVLLVGIALPLSFLALLLTQDNETLFLRASLAALAMTLATAFWFTTWVLVAGRDAGWWSPNVFGLLMVGLLTFDLAATGAYTDISENDPTVNFQHSEIVAFLQEQPGPFRIDTMTGIESSWQPDTAALTGLEDLGGISNPLSLSHWLNLLEATGGRASLLYDMLNAEYVIVQDGTPLPEGKFQLAFDAPGPLAVYRNPMALPRAWIVHEASLAANLDEALAAIQTDDFNPTDEVVLVADALPPLAQSTTDVVDIAMKENDRIVVDVQTDGDGILVLSEVWYPGWRAAVDGIEAPVLAANGGLRAVPVSSGQSIVELWFQPRSWRVGLVAASIGVLFLAAWAVASYLIRRNSRT